MSDRTAAVVSGAAQVLAHAPGLVELGSKPSRQIAKDADLSRRIRQALRSFERVVAYPPHQAFIGALHPRSLPERPWVGVEDAGASRFGPSGEVMPEEEFLVLLAAMDAFGLVTLGEEVARRGVEALEAHPLSKRLDLRAVERAVGDVAKAAQEPGALALPTADGSVAAAVRRAHDVDEALFATVLLENLAAKATATLALVRLIDATGVEPESIEYVIGCGEEAVGDRYQRGGGNLAKAVAEAAGLSEASGADVKNFCAAPVPALVVASSLVAAGVFERVAVVAGGSLAKLGMKFEGHLKHGLPVLEDVIGGAAALVERDDGVSPRVRLDVVGRHPVRAGGANPAIIEALVAGPLQGVGIGMDEVDDYAAELHNPEITEPQGSGNVPERNYRTIAAVAARRGEIERADIEAFVARHGMPGFAPTQGHLASALCYLPHALAALTEGRARRAMLLAKGSLFLGRMSNLSDGMSVLLERNPSSSEGAA